MKWNIRCLGKKGAKIMRLCGILGQGVAFCEDGHTMQKVNAEQERIMSSLIDPVRSDFDHQHGKI